MANNYNDILTLVNAGNQMGLSNTIKRDYGIPLDFTSIQESYDAAIAYAATSTLAYVGQTVAVGAKLYIISDVANGTYTIGEGENAVTYDNFLAEVGSKTEGDGNTIELDGQTLKLAGLTGLDNSKTYVPSLVNGKLVWAEPSATTVEGLDIRLQAVEGKATALEAIVNGTEEAEGLVAKVAANTQAIADETAAREAADSALDTKIAEALQAAKDYADANDADTVYDDTDVKADIQTNATALENLGERVTTVEGKVTQVEADIQALESSIAGITHFTTKVVTSIEEVTEVGVLYLIKDESVAGVDKYNEYLYIDGQAVLIGDTTTDLSNYVTNDALTEAIKNFVTTTALNAALEPYAKTADVNGALADKANSADVVANTAFDTFKTENTQAIATAKQEAIEAAAAAEESKGYAIASEVAETYATKATTLAGYGITDAYTKAETVAKTDVYTKTEIDKLLDDVTGGSSESAASVKRALDGYIQSTDTEIYGAELVASWTGEDGTYTPLYSESTSRIDSALADAARGIQDASKANAAIVALVTTVDGHTTSIADINNALAAIVQPKASAEISVAEDGTLGVVEVNVNKLVQTDDDTLILDGGNAQ